MLKSILGAALIASSAMGGDGSTSIDSTIELQEVTVSIQQDETQLRMSQPTIQVSNEFLQQNFAGSLMQTLESLPGVKAMSVGSGVSKPAIRGLGFNRMAVVEDGVKHEGQQWGDDHGLEIDQFAVDRVEVIKGPAALLYGSDAIGGVLNLYTNEIPTQPMSGSVQLFGRSNNGQLGLSTKVGGIQGNWFYKLHATLLDYADSHVPADSIQYYSYWIHLKDQRLRNTAGYECDGSVTIGYTGNYHRTSVRFSDSYSKSGFFANAHGLEVRLSDIDYDHSRRDIDLPHQWVNHLKVLSHTTWSLDSTNLELNVSYQNNHREEHSEPISHGYMPKPNGSLERCFNKHTFSGSFAFRHAFKHHELRAGASWEHQHNQRGGWGFIIPDFVYWDMGGYVMDRFTLRKNLILNAGVRFDYAQTHISSYNDWYKTPVGGDSIYVERSSPLDRHFRSFIWSVGVNRAAGHWNFKTNIGKSFRIPIPKELGADGINYHIFRYERGNSTLDPEVSYQLDAGVGWSNDILTVQVDPYVNYFPNYIYLSPTAQYVEGLQLYLYTQTDVMRWGTEWQLTWHITPKWETFVQGEYLYARQCSGEKKGYTLPFCPPWSTDVGVMYKYNLLGDGTVKLSTHIVGSQNEIVPPEKPTEGYWTLNFAATKMFKMKKNMLNVKLRVDNLLNRRYYDHTSFYRLIDVPEPGRSISLMVGLDF